MRNSSIVSKVFIILCVASQALGTYFIIYGCSQMRASETTRQMILAGIVLVIIPLIIEGITMYASRVSDEL